MAALSMGTRHRKIAAARSRPQDRGSDGAESLTRADPARLIETQYPARARLQRLSSC
jgi:hypothetical protein